MKTLTCEYLVPCSIAKRPKPCWICAKRAEPLSDHPAARRLEAERRGIWKGGE